MQVTRGGKGAFDARTIAHDVIVPFDQQNENVLGGSEEPYVSNPLRVSSISPNFRSAQKNKEGWDQLCFILDIVEEKNNKEFTFRLFRQILFEIYKRLSSVRVTYPVPRRVSLKRTIEVIEKFLDEQSGGDRLLALSCALFVVMGKKFQLYDSVKRGSITSADQASGMLADLECVSAHGQIVFAVEVKDRQITIKQIKAKLRTIKEKRVSEIFFVAQGVVESENPEVQTLVEREFATGQNVYITDLINICSGILAVLGEDGRREFLQETANQLETYRSEINHRKAWASLLEAI